MEQIDDILKEFLVESYENLDQLNQDNRLNSDEFSYPMRATGCTR